MRELLVVSTGTQVTAQNDARSLTDNLLHGYTGQSMGEGRRFSVADMSARDWLCHDRGLWPIGARASTSFGGGWDTRVLVGPPRVYPRHGDIRGAWAPRTRDSHVEWIELDYARGAPPVSAIRVFETNDPGASFAVTAIDGGAETLLWQRPPSMIRGGAQVLEIALGAPRRIERLRVYVSNAEGSSWSEVDTVGLVAADPLPEAMRTQFKPRSGVRWGCLGAVGTLLAAGACLGMVALYPGSPSAGSPMPPAPTQRVGGTSIASWAAGDLSGVIWSTALVAFSSEYGTSINIARTAIGAPDVYPRHGDVSGAWAPATRDGSDEFIEVRFDAPVRANAVVVVETNAVGAVRRVDDVTPGRPGAILWEGVSGVASEARLLAVTLSEPREISAVRVVLDTGRVDGWNEIDAIGLRPAP